MHACVFGELGVLECAKKEEGREWQLRRVVFGRTSAKAELDVAVAEGGGDAVEAGTGATGAEKIMAM